MPQRWWLNSGSRPWPGLKTRGRRVTVSSNRIWRRTLPMSDLLCVLSRAARSRRAGPGRAVRGCAWPCLWPPRSSHLPRRILALIFFVVVIMFSSLVPWPDCCLPLRAADRSLTLLTGWAASFVRGSRITLLLLVCFGAVQCRRATPCVPRQGVARGGKTASHRMSFRDDGRVSRRVRTLRRAMARSS